MKKLLLFLLLPLSLQAYQQPGKAPKSNNEQVTLVCKIIGAPDNAESIGLFEQVGLAYREVTRGQRQPDKSYLITLPVSDPRIYSIGFNESQNGRVILGREKDLTLWANIDYMPKARTVGSAINKAYEGLRGQLDSLRAVSDELGDELRQARASRDADAIGAVNKKIESHNQAKTQLLAGLKKENPMFWRSATLELYPNFTSDKPNGTGELEFYSKEFFAYADLNDPAYEDAPEVYDAFQRYVLTISHLGANVEASAQMFTEQLAKLTPGTNTHRRAYSGILSGLQTTNHPGYATFSRKYIDAYRSKDLGEVGRLEYELKRTSTFTAGMEAPDLVGKTPEGGEYALSKLRGKYVLIDFWASWCGPCRRENPNVKALYERYKDKGFDILGVSLDRTEDAWKKAIEQDGLSWHHISDLQGWKSEHAALYSVSSIPQTLLLDPEGRIIQRNLRGEQLGAKLKELFGE